MTTHSLPRHSIVSGHRALILVILVGFVLRVCFYLFGAIIYYGSSGFELGPDTGWWIAIVENLLSHGVYSSDLGNEYGFFTRPPGYTVFLGIFYLLADGDPLLTARYAVFAQIVLDTVSIYFVYRIAELGLGRRSYGLVAAVLYALYPFAIVWTAIAYAETLSLFLFLAGTLVLLGNRRPLSQFWAGCLMGFAILTRVQLVLVIGPALVAVWMINRTDIASLRDLRPLAYFLLGIVVTYGSWPLRNYVVHDQPIFTQHLGGRYHWAPDIMAFREYIWSVKTDWDPQFSQILGSGEVTWPEASLLLPGDSAELNRAVSLARACGEGFNSFRETMGWDYSHVTSTENCNEEVAAIFQRLQARQNSMNPLNVYVLVPLGNLRKAVFKSELLSPSSPLAAMAGRVLFGFRTVLLSLGIFGLILIARSRPSGRGYGLLVLVGLYAAACYLTLSFLHRNMEIRYLIHADVLLLVPAAFVIGQGLLRIRRVRGGGATSTTRTGDFVSPGAPL
jgi:hypothetical protein